MVKPQFAAVDWGTSSFRLWLMGEDDVILGESRSGEGMTTARETGFSEILEKHLANVNAPADIPVMICGMAGAKQGWQEAGYIDVPSRLSAIPDHSIAIEGQSREIRILPGLAQRDPHTADVMRGEETQLLGCAQSMKSSDCLVAMPGTHSKWVRIVRGEVLGFATFMTGELFQAISGHTILSHAIKDSPGFDGADPAFTQAVLSAFREPHSVSNRLFSVRARGLLFSLSNIEAEATLSGTMIGLELAGAMHSAPKDTPVILVVSGKLRGLYEAALHSLGRKFSTIDADDAVRQGLSQSARTIWQFQDPA
ncbi:2-dehydro-3-deoxygalactonokinase [Rhizobium sp. KVB221]|uniref:2-dehydro-3-deoxygalactonokinase n=1 Tax=Rhizobium setariae TaxID=2801340 RepID=A0A936YQY4_9HYPH|nr:2-dehydro-3-deoxygalactonokinase [Rhizobium setariae]MBL0370740.1 2-dehydro-3-deoxygalactonokinase [Rhizobium setariae]